MGIVQWEQLSMDFYLELTFEVCEGEIFEKFSLRELRTTCRREKLREIKKKDEKFSLKEQVMFC